MAGKQKRLKRKKNLSVRPLLVFSLGGTLLTAGFFLGLPLSCSHQESRSTSVVMRRAVSEKGVRAAKVQKEEVKPQTSYADALRRRDFERAAWLIDGATPDEKKSPEVRYARALVALELKDVETALRSVDQLEETWPLFADEAKEVRLAAARQSLDVTLLQHFIGKSKSPEDLLLLAEAHEKSSSVQKAQTLSEEVLRLLKKKKGRKMAALVLRAHALNARTLAAEGKNRQAAKEYRWLATQGASLDKSRDVKDSPGFDSMMSQLDPSQSLSSAERFGRIETFSSRGLVERTRHEVELLLEMAGGTAYAAKTDARLAWAVYLSRSNYLLAAELFARAAAHGGAARRENLYYEAKALARSHRDMNAIAKYDKLAKLGGKYADHSSFQAARLRFIDGQWSEAIRAYESYLKKFKKGGRHIDSAKRDLPVARLAGEQYGKAIGELQRLLDVEKSPRERARLMELQAVGMLGAKKKNAALSRLNQVIESRPLSFPALLAAARLRDLGEPIPPWIAPGASLTAQEKLRMPLKLSLPEKVWRLSRVGLDYQAERALRMEEARLKKQYGKRSGEALCRLYGQLESAKRRFQIAQSAASWSVLAKAPTSQTAWQWDCIYPHPYGEIVEQETALRKVPAAFVYSIMRQESAFRPRVVSPAAAVGLMQIIPPTAQRIAGEIDANYAPDLMRAPAVNIAYGTYYLRRLLDMFGNRPELAAASYNAGPQALTRWLRAGERLPLDLFIARIPYKETRNYVYRVMGNYARYSYQSNDGKIPVIDLQIPQGLKAPQDAY